MRLAGRVREGHAEVTASCVRARYGEAAGGSADVSDDERRRRSRRRAGGAAGAGRGRRGGRAAGAAAAAGRQCAARLRHECFERDSTRLRLSQVRTEHVTFITSFASSERRRVGGRRRTRTRLFRMSPAAGRLEIAGGRPLRHRPQLGGLGAAPGAR